MLKRPVLGAVVAVGLFLAALMVMGTFSSAETRIERTAVLNGPPDRVWLFFADLRGWPVWFRTSDGERLTLSALSAGTASAVGAVRHAEDSLGYWWEEKVTVFEPEKELVLEGTETGIRENWKQTIKLEPDGPEKTRVTWVIEYRVGGPIMRLANKARIEPMLAQYVEDGLANINPLIPSKEEWGEDPVPAAAPAAAAPAVVQVPIMPGLPPGGPSPDSAPAANAPAVVPGSVPAAAPAEAAPAPVAAPAEAAPAGK